MATYYFRGAGTTNWGTATNWSTTGSGGAGDGAIPTGADNVIFNAGSNSFDITTTNRVCNAIDFTGYSGTWSGNATLTVSGNVTFSPTMTITTTAQLVFSTTAVSTVTSNGKAYPNAINLTNSGSPNVTVADVWTVGGVSITSAGTRTLNGTLNVTGNYTVNILVSGTYTINMVGTGNFAMSSTNTNGITVNINTAGTITMGATVYANGIFNYIAGTVITTGSTMNVGFGGNNPQFNPGTIVWNALVFTNSGTVVLGSDVYVSGNFVNSGRVTQGAFNIWVAGNYNTANAPGAGAAVVQLSNFTVGGTTYVANGTWTSTSSGSSAVVINTTGTITISGIVYHALDFTYVKGTVITTGSTFYLNSASARTINSGTIVWNNVTLSSTLAVTLGSDLIVGATLTVVTGSTRTVNGFNIRARGDMAVAPSFIGTTTLVYEGTGTWSGSGSIAVQFNINTTGILTVSGNVAYASAPGISLKYIAGTVITVGSTLTSTGGVVLDTSIVYWDSVVWTGSGGQNINLVSVFNCRILSWTGTSNKTITGAAGFIVGTLIIGAVGVVAVGTHTLVKGLAYRVTALLQIISSSAGLVTIKSDTAGTMTKLSLDKGGTAQIGYTNFTDVDASAGRTLYTFNGVVTNCININTFTNVVFTTTIITYAKSFA